MSVIHIFCGLVWKCFVLKKKPTAVQAYLAAGLCFLLSTRHEKLLIRSSCSKMHFIQTPWLAVYSVQANFLIKSCECLRGWPSGWEMTIFAALSPRKGKNSLFRSLGGQRRRPGANYRKKFGHVVVFFTVYWLLLLVVRCRVQAQYLPRFGRHLSWQKCFDPSQKNPARLFV